MLGLGQFVRYFDQHRILAGIGQRWNHNAVAKLGHPVLVFLSDRGLDFLVLDGLQESAALIANFNLIFERDVLLAIIVGLVGLAIAFHLATEVNGFAGDEVFVGGFGRSVFTAGKDRVDNGERLIGRDGWAAAR